jgi:hypothetical protein
MSCSDPALVWIRVRRSGDEVGEYGLEVSGDAAPVRHARLARAARSPIAGRHPPGT